MKRFRLNLKNRAIIIACFTASVIFVSCDKTETRLKDKQIITFGFDMPPAVGEINEVEKTIMVILPLGTDIFALTPIINVSPKAIVTPASGITQNFTEPVVYTVTAEDGSTAQYTVTINMENTNQEENTIIGKWELVAQGYYDCYNNNAIVINPVENDWCPYIEFFSNGKMKRTYFFYEEHVETVYEHPFRIDEQFLYENYTDEFEAFIYEYKVEERKLTLYYVKGNIETIPNPIVIYIYKRINK